MERARKEIQKSRGAATYLQLVNMVNIRFTNSTDLLPQIQQFQEIHTQILTNSHSQLSEDLVTFMFCSHLPESYDTTTQQYLDNLTDIVNYKLLDIITQVLQEESRRKAQSIEGGSSLNKFSMVKNLGQKCAKWGKTNHSTQNHWPGGKHPNSDKRKSSPKASSSSGNKNKNSKKGKGKEMGKEKAQEGANVFDISRLPELSITSSESINFSCYETGRKVEWVLDSSSTEHITPDKSDFIEYREFNPAEKAEIMDGKFLIIEGYGKIIR